MQELECSSSLPVAVWFRTRRVGDFKADMLADDKVLLELKAARAIDLAHEKQLLNYLRATDIEVGLLLNFGNKPEFRRLVFENERKKIRVDPRKSAASGG
jgi:GxxExxY protein